MAKSKSPENYLKIRDKTAKDKHFYEKGILIATVLGDYTPAKIMPHTDDRYTFRNSILSIEYLENNAQGGNENHYVAIIRSLENEERLVFEGRLIRSLDDPYNQVRVAVQYYVPGEDWEKEIERLYVKAKKKLDI